MKTLLIIIFEFPRHEDGVRYRNQLLTTYLSIHTGRIEIYDSQS